ncbi:hypothetical protein ACNSTU_17200 [Aquisalimonas sp. APHAB1-3]|uniref:hypothetical protein n=1 Tax=Aquisalimonas sp. APHAB1-3 TaxID=3402080 RepID=UPI003AAD44C6
MADRQMLEDLYEAIFLSTPTPTRLDEAEEELSNQGGSYTDLARDWAARDNSIHSRLEGDDLIFGQLVEIQYAQLFGRTSGDDASGNPVRLTDLGLDSDADILDLDPTDLSQEEQDYFSGGIDIWGFQYWVEQLVEDNLEPDDLSLAMMNGAREFESDDDFLVELNDQGLEYRLPAEDRDLVDLDRPDGHPLELDYGTHDPSNPEESGTRMTPQEDGTMVEVVGRVLDDPEEWWVSGADADDVAVSISQHHDNVREVTPKLLDGVDSLFLRNTSEVDLRDAQDLDSIVFRDTDAAEINTLSPADVLYVENVASSTDLGIDNVSADSVYLDGLSATSVHNTTLQGYQGFVELNGVSSSTTGTRLNIDSIASDSEHDNNIHLVANDANRLSIAGDEDLDLVTDAGMALTRVDARLLEAELDVDVSGPGLAASPTLFNAVVYGSQDDTTVQAGDKLWKDYSSTSATGDSLVFDGYEGYNTLVTNADDIEDFDPEWAWNDARLEETFSVANLHELRVEGGEGDGTLGQRVADEVTETGTNVAEVVADNAVLDTGLFGDDLEEFVVEDASDMHVETRDTLTEATLRDTTNVDLAAGPTLEEVSLSGAEGSTVFADGNALEEVSLSQGASGNTLDRVSEEQVMRFATTGSNDTTINAMDDAESLQLSVGQGTAGTDIELNGENVDTVNASYSSLGGRLEDVDLSGLAEDLTVALEGASQGRVAGFDAIMGDEQDHLTVEGTEEGREELYLSTHQLEGLENGDGVTIGADAVVYLSGTFGDAGNLDIGGEGALGLSHIDTVNLFHADPGAFEVGRYDDSATLESVSTDAPIQVAGSMDELEIGYAQQFSGDAARVEFVDTVRSPWSVDELVFTDGHARDVELYFAGIPEPDEGYTPAYHIGELDTERLGPDENAANTESVTLKGEGNVYLGLGVRDDGDDGTHDRLAGLDDDGEIHAEGGDLNAVIRNETDAGALDEHELDLDQFADTPATLGFAGGTGASETVVSGWEDPTLRFYDGFEGDVVLEPETDDLYLEIFARTDEGHVMLDDAVDGTVNLVAPQAMDVPSELRDDLNSARLGTVDLAGSDDVFIDTAGLSESYWLWMDEGLEALGAEATITFGEAPHADSGVDLGDVTQEADGGDSHLTVVTEGAPDDVDLAQHYIDSVDMIDADEDASLVMEGADLNVMDVDASNAEETVSIEVDGENSVMGTVMAGTAETFEGEFADGISLNAVDADEADNFTATFGNHADVGDLNAENAADFEATFGEDAAVDQIDAGTNTTESSIDVSFGADAEVGTIEAGYDDSEVNLAFGEGADVGGIDAEFADSLSLDLAGDSEVGSLSAPEADTVEINLDGAGNTVNDIGVNGADVTINSNGGGAGVNTVSYSTPFNNDTLTLAGDTALAFGGVTNPGFEDEGVLDATELNANLDLGLYAANDELAIELYGSDVSEADRHIEFRAVSPTDVDFDFSDMAAGQRVEIVGAANDLVDNLDEIEFLLEDVAFVDDFEASDLLINGVGINDVDGDDWEDVFELAGTREKTYTQIHHAEDEAHFELELVGLSADELTDDNFDLIA